jgi:hypothetical protein
MALSTVQRNIAQLKDYEVSDLTPEDRGKKRAEVDLGLKKAILHAWEQFEEWKDEKPGLARSYLSLYATTLMQQAKLFGLESPQVQSFTQINQLNQYTPDKVDMEVGKTLAKFAKAKHEERD